MGSNGTEVDLSFGFRERALSDESRILFVVLGEGQEVVQVSHFTEMRTDRVQEYQLQEDVSLNQVSSRFVLVTVQDIEIFHTCDLVQTVLNHISVDHFLVSLLNFVNLFFNFIFENLIIQVQTLVVSFTLSVSFLFSQGFDQEHFKGG